MAGQTGDSFALCLITREGGNYSDILPLKVARRDSISNLTSCELRI